MPKHSKLCTWEFESEDGEDIEAYDIRIHFNATRYYPATGPSFSSAGEPAEGPECEFESAEILKQGQWTDLQPTDPGYIWALSYFDENRDDFCEVAIDERFDYLADIAEARYEQRRDDQMEGNQ